MNICDETPCPPGESRIQFPDSCCPICRGELGYSLRKFSTVAFYIIIILSGTVFHPPGECTFSEWSDYGPCSLSCGGGRKVRRRRLISIDSGFDAVFCNGSLTEFKDCSQGPCPGIASYHTCKYCWGGWGFENKILRISYAERR